MIIWGIKKQNVKLDNFGNKIKSKSINPSAFFSKERWKLTIFFIPVLYKTTVYFLHKNEQQSNNELIKIHNISYKILKKQNLLNANLLIQKLQGVYATEIRNFLSGNYLPKFYLPKISTFLTILTFLTTFVFFMEKMHTYFYISFSVFIFLLVRKIVYMLESITLKKQYMRILHELL